MVKIRKSADRGRTSTGWIHSAHTFSFGSYFDVQHQGHGNLLVLNEDIVESGKGFGNHGHQDMEIISYVLGGELAHQDKIETGTAGSAYTGIVQYGDIQRVSAGFGMQHSELNNLPNENTHFLQIWIKPNVTGIHPSYEKNTLYKRSVGVNWP